MTKKFRLKVYRGVPGSQYWETYELEERTGLNIVSALMILQRNPVTIDGRRVTPIAYESGCLENVCGSCSMLINGYPKQACAALVRQIIETTKNPEITLAPFTKFPLIRDLMIDRSAMFENLKAISGWIEADATWDHGPGPKITPHEQEVRYVLSTCMTCGCCSEGCPQVNAHSDFMGPAPISQARLLMPTLRVTLKKPSVFTLLWVRMGSMHAVMRRTAVRSVPRRFPLLSRLRLSTATSPNSPFVTCLARLIARLKRYEGLIFSTPT